MRRRRKPADGYQRVEETLTEAEARVANVEAAVRRENRERAEAREALESVRFAPRPTSR